MPPTAFRAGQDMRQLAAAAELDVDALQAHSERLEAMLRACAAPPTAKESRKP